MFEAVHQTNQRSSEEEGGEHEEEASEIGGLSRGLAGRALPDAVRGSMERSFGADFSGVRVHEGGHADAIGARAFATGQDLHFATGEFDPGSHEGRELIGHELAHVVQQRAGTVQGPQGKGTDLAGGLELEREADVAGAAAARGERAHVSGAGSGVQFKGTPRDRSFLDLARDAEAPRIAQAHLDELAKRLGAKAELRFTNTEDGALVERLEQAAAAEVERLAEANVGDTTKKDDIKALSAKIAQRSKAVKEAVGERGRTLGTELAAAGDYKTKFAEAARKAFDQTSVPKIMLSKQILIQQATAAANRAARAIDEAQYQRAKTALDAHLATHIDALEAEMKTSSETKVETRTNQAIAKRDAVDGKITAIASEASKPVFDTLHKEVEGYLVNGLGANGAGWWRSSELRELRKQLKTSARHQAKQDIHTDLGTRTGVGKATGRFVESEARVDAYDRSKESVNATLHELGETLANDVMGDQDVDTLLTDAARRAAFSVYENEGHQPAAKTAAIAAAKAKSKEIHDTVLADAKARKNQVVKSGQTTERDQVEQDVVQRVQDDEVGKKSVDAALKANSPEEGMSKLGHFFDFMVPERGDAIKFKVSLEIPCGPGSFLIELQGDAERGTRERLITKDQHGTKHVSRDTQSLKLAAEIRFGYSGTLPGVKLSGALGLFVRSDAASTDLCMKGLSYGIYRFLSGAVEPLANLWGSNGKKSVAMAQTDPNNPDEDLQDDVYRAELWAAMVEEQVFKKDKEARVDLGVSGQFGAEVNAGVAKAKGQLRGEVMRSYTKKALERSGDEYNTQHSPGHQVSLGDDSFDKDEARERRKALHGKTMGAFALETEVETKIAGQAFVFQLKLKITPPTGELELSGGLKLTTNDPADKQVRLIAGIAGAAQNAIKMIASMARNLVDQDHALAGVLGDIADMGTRSLADINNVANNQFGKSITDGYQVKTEQNDQVNEGLNSMLGGDKAKPETTKAGAVQESVYKVSLCFGKPRPFMLKIDEVQTTKVAVGGGGGPGLNIEYEKSRRVGQIGSSDGKFHGELFGISTKT